jgi:hypothetical protein
MDQTVWFFRLSLYVFVAQHDIGVRQLRECNIQLRHAAQASKNLAIHLHHMYCNPVQQVSFQYFFVVCGAFLADAYAFRSSVKTIVKFGRQYCEKKHDETLSRAMLYPPKSSVELTRELNVSKL